MDQVKLMGNIMNKDWGIDQFFCNLTPLRLEKCAYFVPIFSLILASGLDAWDLSNPNMFIGDLVDPELRISICQ